MIFPIFFFFQVADDRDDIVELLVENGANLDCKDRNGRTALHRSIVNCESGNYFDFQLFECLGYEKVMKLLIAHGADVNAQDNQGFNALQMAVQNGKSAIFKHEKGTFVTKKMDFIPDKVKIVEYLIENGADINAKNNDGQTALHLCINGGSYAVKPLHSVFIAEMLIKNDAEVDVQDKNEQNTPLHLAAAEGKILELKP